MIPMGLPPGAFAVWNWWLAGRVESARVRGALAAASGHPVVALGAVQPPPAAALLCDVWHGGGDFPTFVDCYLAPAVLVEVAVAAGLASRLAVACLLPDDTLNPTRHVLAGPDGTLRPVHVDVTPTDDGEIRTGLRFCTLADPWCRRCADCAASRWGPDSVAPAVA